MRIASACGSIALVALASAAVRPAAAITVDGRLDPEYGAALVVQSTQTGFDDNTAGLVEFANGSELDAAYASVSDGVLHLFFSGNLASRLVPSDSPDFSDFLRVYLDCAPGGQNPLIDDMPGFRFDAGFEPDYVLRCYNIDHDWAPGGLLVTSEETLPAGGGGLGEVLGTSPPGGPGTLAGGTNPFGVQAAIDCSNTAGVSAGCGASTPGAVVTGIEWSIPLSAIGNPAGCIGICAIVTDHVGREVSNQVLPPVPPGTCDLGPSSTVNLDAVAGAQFFQICPALTPTAWRTWGSLKSRYR